jgi:hypothetical protein
MVSNCDLPHLSLLRRKPPVPGLFNMFQRVFFLKRI